MTLAKIRVLIADDHAMVRAGLATMLKIFDELEFIGEAPNGEAAVILCDELQPDLVLMDMQMPTMDGIAATRAIRQKHPEIKVLAVTGHMQDDMIQQALQAGVVGYVSKSALADELLNAIHSALAGQITLSPQAVQSLLLGPRSEPSPNFGLTEREGEVLECMIQGLSNNAIAERLHVSPMTVKTHVSSILAKMHVATRGEAVAVATRRNHEPC